MDAKIRIVFQMQKEIEENLFDLTSINYLNVKFCLSFNISVYLLAHFQV